MGIGTRATARTSGLRTESKIVLTPGTSRPDREIRGPGSVGPSSLDRPHGQRELERASLADLALAPDAAAVHLDEAFRKGEPEAGPLALLGASFRLLKLLEDAIQILGGDARAAVGDRNPHLAVHPRRADVDLAALRSELHGVREQIEDDLPDPALVSRDNVEAAVLVQRDLDAFGGRLFADHRDAALECVLKRKRRNL